MLLLFAALITVAAAPPGAPHVLNGAQAFRDGHFEDAVIEFEVARELGEGGATLWYLAAALGKAQRPEDAVEAFERAHASAPGFADALLEYHWAMACYDAHLLTCAGEHLARVSEAAGPRVGGLAAKVRKDVLAALAKEPSPEAIDLLVSRARALAAARPLLARALAREAKALGLRRTDRHGQAAAEALLPGAGT